jgi:hypothetical protein
MDALYRREKVPERDELKKDLLGDIDPMNAHFVKKDMEDGKLVSLIRQFE